MILFNILLLTAVYLSVSRNSTADLAQLQAAAVCISNEFRGVAMATGAAAARSQQHLLLSFATWQQLLMSSP